MDYFVKRVKDISMTTISEFEEKNADGTKKFSRMIIEEGFRAKIWYLYAKFSFILERTDWQYDDYTMSEFKKKNINNPAIKDVYYKYKNTKKECVKVFL